MAGSPGGTPQSKDAPTDDQPPDDLWPAPKDWPKPPASWLFLAFQSSSPRAQGHAAPKGDTVTLCGRNWKVLGGDYPATEHDWPRGVAPCPVCARLARRSR